MLSQDPFVSAFKARSIPYHHFLMLRDPLCFSNDHSVVVNDALSVSLVNGEIKTLCYRAGLSTQINVRRSEGRRINIWFPNVVLVFKTHI